MTTTTTVDQTILLAVRTTILLTEAARVAASGRQLRAAEILDEVLEAVAEHQRELVAGGLAGEEERVA